MRVNQVKKSKEYDIVRKGDRTAANYQGHFK